MWKCSTLVLFALVLHDFVNTKHNGTLYPHEYSFLFLPYAYKRPLMLIVKNPSLIN
jgi:hypothetical protein